MKKKLLSFLIVCLFFMEIEQAKSVGRITGVSAAKIIESATQISSPQTKFNLELSSYNSGNFANLVTQIYYEANGESNGFVNVELIGTDEKKLDDIEGSHVLPIELKNEHGDIVSAKLFFFDDKVMFNKNGQAQIKTIMKIDKLPSAVFRRRGGIYRAFYYVKIQH